MNPDKTFSCNKNGGNFSERVENTVGKRENYLCEQFLLFHSNGIFKRLALQTHKNRGLSEKELKKTLVGIFEAITYSVLPVLFVYYHTY